MPGGLSLGHLATIWSGFPDLSPIRDAAAIAAPSFTTPTVERPAIAFIPPVAIAPAGAHSGDVPTMGTPTGKHDLVHAGSTSAQARNRIIVSTFLTFGLGGMPSSLGNVRLEGSGRAGLAGLQRNGVLPHGSGNAESSEAGGGA